MMYNPRNNVELTTSFKAAKFLFDQARITSASRKGRESHGENTRTDGKRYRNDKQMAWSSEQGIHTARVAETPPLVPHSSPLIPRHLLQTSKTSQMECNDFAQSSAQLITDGQACRRILGTRHEAGWMTSNPNYSARVKKTKFRAEWTGNRTRKKSISVAKNKVRISHRASKTLVSLEINKNLKIGRAVGRRTITAEKNICRSLELVRNLLAFPPSCIQETNEILSLKEIEVSLANTNATSSIIRETHKSDRKSTNSRTLHKREQDSRIVDHGMPGSGIECCALNRNEIVKYEESELLQLEIALQNALMHVASASSLQRPPSSSNSVLNHLATYEQAGKAQTETKDRIESAPARSVFNKTESNLRPAFVKAINDFRRHLQPDISSTFHAAPSRRRCYDHIYANH